MDDSKRETIRVEKLKNISIGNIDPSGRKIYDVYARSDEFVIYSIRECGTIQGIAVIIEEKDPNNLIPTNNFQEIKGEHALSVAILNGPERAKTLLNEIHSDIENAYKELVFGKLLYITGAFLMAMIFSTLSIYLYLAQPEMIVQERTTLYHLILVSSMATLGGLISISRSIHKISIDKGLGQWPYFVYGIERNMFSILGGVFIFFLIKSNLLFGFINSLENPLYGFMTFGFLSGFSETLIPNALKNLEKGANKESTN